MIPKCIGIDAILCDLQRWYYIGMGVSSNQIDVISVVTFMRCSVLQAKYVIKGRYKFYESQGNSRKIYRMPRKILYNTSLLNFWRV
jgi:hypothetical protein